MKHILSGTSVPSVLIFCFSIATIPSASLGVGSPLDITDFRELDEPSIPSGHFGLSIDAHQGKVIVGAWATAGGYSYIYDTRSGTELHRLRGSDTRANDLFGRSVSMNDQYALVGANQAQAAYVFDVVTGQQLWKLPDPDAPPTFGFGFGISTSISGNIGVVGDTGDDEVSSDAGAAYIYDLSSGQLLKKLLAPGPSPILDRFGTSVFVDGNNLLIGAPEARGNSSSSGAVYVYDAAGTFQRELVAFDPGVDDFGWSIAVSGNLALIGAPRHREGSERTGSVYLFDISTGDLLRTILPPDLSDAERFGHSVSFDGRYALIGDPSSVFEGTFTAGKAFYYDALSGELLATLMPEENPEFGDNAGWSVDIERNTLLVGSDRDFGHVYLVEIPEPSTAVLLVFSFFQLLSYQESQHYLVIS